MSHFETVIYEKKDSIVWITLNRPRVLNVYNVQMRDELHEILGAIRDDSEVRVAIFKGAGDKAFCAGADLSEFLTAPSPVIARRARWERDIWGELLSLTQPLIAALHGYVLGSGLEIALCCDVRIAAGDARFGFPEAGRGIIPGAGGTQNLPRAIGCGKALEMILTGRQLTAQEALEVRLVNQVVPKDELIPTAEKLARHIASLNPRAVRSAKQAMVRGLDLTLDEGLELEKRLVNSLLSNLQ